LSRAKPSSAVAMDCIRRDGARRLCPRVFHREWGRKDSSTFDEIRI